MCRMFETFRSLFGVVTISVRKIIILYNNTCFPEIKVGFCRGRREAATMALVAKNAALLVEDAEAVDNLLPQALQIVADDNRLRELSANIRQLALPNSAQAIAEVILAQIENKK